MKWIEKVKRWMEYRKKKNLWLKSHEAIEVTTPTLSRMCFIDMTNPFNARRMKLFNKREQIKMHKVLKELEEGRKK